MAEQGSDSCRELANRADVENVIQNVPVSMSLLQDLLTSTSIEGDRNQVFQGCTFNVAMQQTCADSLQEREEKDATADSEAKKRKKRRNKKKRRAGKKTQFVKELRYKYEIWSGEIQPAPFLHDKYDIDQLFVPSGIEYLEERDGKKEKWRVLKDYKTVFVDPQIKSKRRIIDGEPGYGKSTLALQIAHDWCEGTAPMNAYEIVILLRLRQFRNVPTIYSAIKRFLLPKDSTLTEDDIKDILDNSSTLVVLDGYDEYPGRETQRTDINEIINGNMFQQHEVVLTTRTSCLPPSHTNVMIKRLRLTGFGDVSRETYIKNVVARGCSEVADKISTFLKVNPVCADFCKIPLFFAMISFMVKISERFGNVTTATELFRHIIKCFHCHRHLKGASGTLKMEHDHSKLDGLALEGLIGNAQQICWGKNKLTDEIGKDLYDEYVRIGILVEEESFDFDALEYNIETRFFHKLFAEWFAAHLLAEIAAHPAFIPKRPSVYSLQLFVPATCETVYLLKVPNPFGAHYMYRFACGLKPETAPKIIELLSCDKDCWECTMLCIMEWGGNLDIIRDTAMLLCVGTVDITITDSLLLQKSTIALIEFASCQKTGIFQVCLDNCLCIGSAGNLRVRPSNLPLPVMDTLVDLLWIDEPGSVITQEETDSILQYAAKSSGLKELGFSGCLFPRCVKVTETMAILSSRKTEVEWLAPGAGSHVLNLSSGQWEKCVHNMSEDGRQELVKYGTPMTDEEYQNSVENFHEKAKIWKQRLRKQLREIGENENDDV